MTAPRALLAPDGTVLRVLAQAWMGRVYTRIARFKDWNEAEHPRAAAGTPKGGQWVRAEGPGISRGVEGAWTHIDTGEAVHPDIQKRLDDLKIPPMWSGVRLNPDPQGALQAIGVDRSGRLQRLYSAAHRESAAAEKFARLSDFTKALPGIRKRINADLSNAKAPAASREAAAVLRLIDRTGFRVGSDRETFGKADAYGASTLRAEHVKVEGDTATFSFSGKHGVQIEKTLTDAAIASDLRSRIARGGKLFDTTDAKVRDYLHDISGAPFKVKDFRTYNGTSEALRVMREMAAPTTQKAFDKARTAVSKSVAAHLGNTPAVARAAYIDPSVWGAWEAGIIERSAKHSDGTEWQAVVFDETALRESGYG